MPDIIESVGFPFTSVGGDRATGANSWRQYFDKMLTGHVVPDAGNEMEVKPQGTPNKSVYVDTGAVFIIGAMLIKASTETLSIADNASGNARVDRIVARINFADRKVELVVKQGTPSASPTAPSLVQDTSTYYEVSLARIAVANGFTTITSGEITDERDDVSVCGYARFRVSNATTSIDGLMSATDKVKLDGVEDGATADQTGAEIKSLYEAQANTNAYSDTEKTKVSNADSHRTNTNNPHGTDAAGVNLGNVQNYGIASQAEAEAGTASNKYMTPERVQQNFEANQIEPLFVVNNTNAAYETGTLATFTVGDYKHIFVDQNYSAGGGLYHILDDNGTVHLVGQRAKDDAGLISDYTLSATPEKISYSPYGTDPEITAEISGTTISIKYAIGSDANEMVKCYLW